MSSARKRAAIQKANNEANHLRQRLMRAEHHGNVMQGFAEVAARKADALQAQLDALMLEFCPDEMTDAQRENWARHQKPVSDDTQREIDSALMGSNAPHEGPGAASSRTVPLDAVVGPLRPGKEQE